MYGIDVARFCDGDGDGIGDFKGLISKLPYLADLGITCIWLLPFYPSLLRLDRFLASEGPALRRRLQEAASPGQ